MTVTTKPARERSCLAEIWEHNCRRHFFIGKITTSVTILFCFADKSSINDIHTKSMASIISSQHG